ncbi:unnamed protein product [Ectocarpus sp. 6 AP-2014]
MRMERLKSVFTKDSCQKYYNLTRILGKGSFATVKLAVRKSDGTKWAVKVIEKTALSQEDEEALKNEVQILGAMNHPNIVRLNQVFDCQNCLYMVMELCTGGELFDRIVMKDHYTENEARDCIIQMTKAIMYCHQNGIVHRDLKPENLLYSDFDEGTAVLKLADFGLAKLCTENTMLNTACGTPGYVAPEILEGRPYGKEVDMWSVGVIAYILLCGFPPFYDENNSAMFKAIKLGKYDFPSPFWDDVDCEAKDMIGCLLVTDAAKRYSAEQLLQHPWVAQGHTEAGEHNLNHFKNAMKAYNARRKFKATIMTVQLMGTLGRAMKTSTVEKAAAAEGDDSSNPAKIETEGPSAEVDEPVVIETTSTTVGEDPSAQADEPPAVKAVAPDQTPPCSS